MKFGQLKLKRTEWQLAGLEKIGSQEVYYNMDP